MRVSVYRLSATNPRRQQAAFVWKWLRRYCFEPGAIASIFIASLSSATAASDNAAASVITIVAAI
jgi:hypothetical protein